MLIAAFPSGVLGPVDFWALRRLASNCLSVAIEFSLPTKPNWSSNGKNTGRNACGTDFEIVAKSVTEGVHADNSFSLGGFGASRFLGVASVGLELLECCHRVFLTNKANLGTAKKKHRQECLCY